MGTELTSFLIETCFSQIMLDYQIAQEKTLYRMQVCVSDVYACLGGQN